MKHITLKIAGSDNEPIDIFLHPAVTVQDILDAAELKGYVLCLDRNPAKSLSLEEEAYGQLKNGDTLYAVLPAGKKLVNQRRNPTRSTNQ